MSQLWRIQLFGGLKVCRDGQEIFRFRTRKAGALLALLAYPPHQNHSRDQLIGQFWPNSDLDHARHSLCQTLHVLRRHLEPPGIPAGSLLFADHSCVRLNPAAFTTDVDEFSAAIQLARQAKEPQERLRCLEQAASLYGGALLPRLYEEWVLLERERWQSVFSAALRQGAAYLLKEGDGEKALELLLRAVAVNPEGMEAREDLVRLYATLCRQDEAQQQYRLLTEHLDLTGQQPPEALRALLHRRDGDSPRRYLQ